MQRYAPAVLLLGIASSVMLLWRAPILGASDSHVGAQLPATGTWVEVGTGSASGEGIGYGKLVGQSDNSLHSLSIDSSGHPVVAWTHQKNVHHGQVYIKRFDGTDWQEVGLFSASFGVGISNTSGDSQWPSLDLDALDTPWVAWGEETSTDWEIYVKWFNGSDWVGWGSGGGISDTTDDSKFPSLALDSLGTPYVAWTQYVTTTTQIYVKRFDGTNWVEVGSASASGGGVSSTPDASEHPALVLDDSDTPYVAWEDSTPTPKQIYVKRFDGEDWVEVGAGSASGGGITDNSGHGCVLPSMALDGSGYPHVAWAAGDDTWLPFSVNQVYLRRFDGSDWVEVGANSASGPGISAGYYNANAPSLALDESGTPYVAWHHGDHPTNEQIYLKRFDGDTWSEVGGSASEGGISNTTGPGGSGTGYSRSPALAIDASGRPYVAWGESTSFDMYIYIRRFAPTWQTYFPLIPVATLHRSGLRPGGH